MFYSLIPSSLSLSLTSFPIKGSQACQHCDSAWHHPHPEVSDARLWIPSESHACKIEVCRHRPLLHAHAQMDINICLADLFIKLTNAFFFFFFSKADIIVKLNPEQIYRVWYGAGAGTWCKNNIIIMEDFTSCPSGFQNTFYKSFIVCTQCKDIVIMFLLLLELPGTNSCYQLRPGRTGHNVLLFIWNFFFFNLKKNPGWLVRHLAAILVMLIGSSFQSRLLPSWTWEWPLNQKLIYKWCFEHRFEMKIWLFY